MSTLTLTWKIDVNNANSQTSQKFNDSQAKANSAAFLSYVISSDTTDTAPENTVSSGPPGLPNQHRRPVIWMHPVSTANSSLPPINALPGDAAKAILSEIRTSAERYSEHGVPHSIDLRFLKSTPDERATLVMLLGRGEVSAIVNSVGRSEVQETAIPCVWWIRHFNSDDEIVGELIEISDVPNLLVSDRSAIAHSLDALYSTLHANALPGAR